MRYFIIHPRVETNTEYTFTEHDAQTDTIISTIQGTFDDVYPIFLKDYHNAPIFINQIRSKLLMDVLVEELGYMPIEERLFIDVSRLSQILLPKKSSKGNTESTEEPLVSQVSTMLSIIGSLPLITLQVMADAYADWIALQAILNEWILLRMKEEGAREKQVTVVHELAFQPVAQFETSIELMDDDPFDEDFGNFADKCTHFFTEQTHRMLGLTFEDRPGQLQMMKKVAQALSSDLLLVIEAGTGTGKSLAYLLPSALFAMATGEKVLVATHTIALQEQLRTKDIPILLSMLDEPLNVAILKGRNHYLCMRKLARYMRSSNDLTRAERDFMFKLAIWISETESGDREEISLTGNEVESWRLVQSETETCLNKKCPFFRHCYYFSARQKAAEAHIVLANHSLILSDLAADHRILPNYRHLVIDEAHHLEDQATKQFGAEITQFELQKILDRVAGSRGMLPDLHRSLVMYNASQQGQLQRLQVQVEQLQRITLQATEDMKTFWTFLGSWLKHHYGKSEIRITKQMVEEISYQELKDATNWLSQTRKQLAQSHTEFERLRMDLDTEDPLYDRLEELSGRIKELIFGQQICVDVVLAQLSESDYVGWVTKRDTGDAYSLHLAPLSVAKILKQELFEDKSSVILTSATLAVAGTFQYLEDRTGLAMLKDTGRVAEAQVTSPFSYRDQALLCVPSDMPDVRSEPHFSEAVAASIIKIATLTKGRTMALFTSRLMLREVHERLEQPLTELGITTLAQGIHDHRRTLLLERFKSSTPTVLLGLDSFWEGVDVQGEALTSLIIVKLPFPVPSHPIIEARSELIKQNGKQPFREYSIPQAVIRFTQGFGRLIRAQTDRGVIFVLDKRIVTERYGRLFLESIPNVPLFNQPLENIYEQAKKYI